MKYFGIGKFSKYHIYIIIVIICQVISDYLMGMNKINKREVLEIFRFYPKLKRHLLFKNLFEFLGFILGAIILYFVTKRYFNDKGDKTMTEIQEKREVYLENKITYNYISLIVVSFFLSVNIIINSIAITLQIDNHFWIIELISICFFSSFIFKHKIKNHHKVAIIIIAPLIFLDLITLSLPMTHHQCPTEEECKEKYISDNNVYEFINKKYGVYKYLVVSIILFSIIMKDYSWIKEKYLIDIRGINVYKILLSIGVTGSILVLICLLILSIIPCNDIKVNNVDFIHEFYTDVNNITIPMSSQVCFVTDYDEAQHSLKFYYDHFIVFFREFHLDKNKDLLDSFLIIPLYFVMNLIINVSNIMMISYLDPNYILINRNFSYFIEKFIFYFFIAKCNEEIVTFNHFFLDEIVLSISILSNIIYIEFLQLKFCNLDYDLKINIEIRSENERISKLKSIELTDIDYMQTEE